MKNRPMALSYVVEAGEEEKKTSGIWGKIKGFFEKIDPQALLIILILLAIGFAIFTAFKNGNGLGWLFELKKPISDQPFPDDVGKALGPILALALMIERLLETVFDIFERNWKQVAKYGNAAGKGLGYLEEMLNLYSGEMYKAKSALQEAVGSGKPEAEVNALMQKVDEAEKRVMEASDSWAALTKDPKYLAWKRSISIWTGLFLGLIVAILSDKGVFQYLNMGVPRLLDMLVTGFVIGAGSGPMHSLIGILQSAKSTLDNVGSLTGVSALQDDLKEIKAAIQK